MPKQSKVDPSQLNNLFFQYDVPLKNIANLKHSFIVRALVGIFLISLIFVFFYKVPQEAELPFEIKMEGETTVYQYESEVKVLETHVSINEEVAKDFLLMKISSEEILSTIAKLRNSREAFETFLGYTLPGLTRKIELKKDESESAKIAQHLLITQKEELEIRHQLLVEELQEVIDLVEKKYNRGKLLYASRTISELQLENMAQELLDARSRASATKLELELRIRELEVSISDYEQRLNQLINEIELLELEKTERKVRAIQEVEQYDRILQTQYGHSIVEDDGITLMATQKGVVTYLRSREKITKAQSTLLRIENTPGTLEAVARIGQRDLALVEKKMPVKLKFSNFPFFRFGTLQGTVLDVSKVGIEGDYLVIVSIDDKSNRALADKVRDGMGGTASVLLEEQSLISYIINR